jgi:serine/threonine-protein kinase
VSAVEQVIPERLGEFEITGLLGSGGSGQVYEARWGPRRVALKVLHINLLATADVAERFFAEAQLLAEIGHPGIVKILNFGTLDDGRPYLAMEFLEGEVLAARLARGPLSLEAALELCDQLAEALDAVHRQSLIHRDLKPENVLVAQIGADRSHAVLLDFGIAKALDAPASTTTQEGGVRGTPAYMAPERFFGQPASIASDVYELAVLFYGAVVGELPWSSSVDPEGRLNPQRPGERGATLRPALETAMMRGLSTRPEARPATAGELAAELRAAAGIARSPRGQTGVSPRVTAAIGGSRPAVESAEPFAPTEHQTTPARRRRRWPLIAIAAGVVIAGGSGAAVALGDRGDVEVMGAADLRAIESTRESLQWGAERADDPPPVRRQGDDSGLPLSIKHLPADVDIVLGLRFRELRQSAAFARLIDREKKNEPLRMVVAATGTCGIDLFEDIDWITLGIAGEQRDQMDLIIAGNFERDKIQSCLTSIAEAFVGSSFKAVEKGAVTEMRGGGTDKPWHLLWIDERTVMVSSRAGAGPDWLAARRDGEESVETSEALAPGFAAVDREATIWMVGKPDTLNAGGELQSIPIPELLWGDLAISDRISLEATMVYPDRERAEEADRALEKAFKQVTGDPMASAMVGELSSDVVDNRVGLRFKLGKIATQLVASAVEKAIREGSL